VCGSAATMCGSVRQCERQCAVIRTARGSVRQCAAVVIIIVILQPPCFATNCCYNNTAAPVLRNNYYYNARVIYGSAGGLRTGHVRICGWSTDLRVGIGWCTGYPCRGHGVPIGQMIIQITAAPGGVSCATIIMIIIMIR
jgi:hypothetical protein